MEQDVTLPNKLCYQSLLSTSYKSESVHKVICNAIKIIIILNLPYFLSNLLRSIQYK